MKISNFRRLDIEYFFLSKRKNLEKSSKKLYGYMVSEDIIRAKKKMCWVLVCSQW